MKVILAGVCKNIEKCMPYAIAGFYKLAQHMDCRAIFYENNSTDNTSKILKEWMKRDARVVALTETLTHEELLNMCRARTCDNQPCRMELIARARNKVMEYMEREEYDDVEYIIMFDMDNTEEIPVDAIVKVLNTYKDFDALICRGGVGGDFYDHYAFRNSDYPMGPEYIGDAFWHPANIYKTTHSTVGSKEKLIPVYSAFNGLAILRKAAVKGVRYKSEPTRALHDLYVRYKDKHPMNNIKTHYEGILCGIYLFDNNIWFYNNSGYNYPVVCEHVTFFLDMRSNGHDRIYMCTDLVWNFNR